MNFFLFKQLATDLRQGFKQFSENRSLFLVLMLSLMAAQILAQLIIVIADSSVWFLPSGLNSEASYFTVRRADAKGHIEDASRFDTSLIQQRSQKLANISWYAEHEVEITDKKGSRGRQQIATASSDLLTTLHLKLQLGEQPLNSKVPAVYLTDQSWRDWYHRDPNVLKNSLWILDDQYVISGILPKNFSGLSNTQLTVVLIGTTNFGWATQSEVSSMEVDAFGSMVPDKWIVGSLQPAVQQKQLTEIIEQINANIVSLTADRQTFDNMETQLTLFSGIHRDPTTLAHIETIISLLAMALLLLSVIVFSTYLQISMDQLSSRKGEFQMRFVMGATKTSIIRQLVQESLGSLFLISIFAVTLTFVIGFQIHKFALFSHLNFHLSGFIFVKLVFITFVVVTLLTGALQALVVARKLNTQRTLSGVLNSRSLLHRKQSVSLFVIQVALSLLFLSLALNTANNLIKLKKVDYGFQPKGVSFVRIGINSMGSFDESESIIDVDLIASGLKDAGEGIVQKMAIGRRIPLGDALEAGQLALITRHKAISVDINYVSSSFFETLENSQLSQSRVTPGSLVLSASAMNELGMDSQQLTKSTVFVTKRNQSPIQYAVSGVVQDVHYYSAVQDIKPTVYVIIDKFDVLLDSLILKQQSNKEVLSKEINTLLGSKYKISTNNTVQELIDQNLNAEHQVNNLMIFISILSLLLVAAGIVVMVRQYVAAKLNTVAIHIIIGAKHNSLMGIYIQDLWLPFSLGALGYLLLLPLLTFLPKVVLLEQLISLPVILLSLVGLGMSFLGYFIWLSRNLVKTAPAALLIQR